MLRAVVLTQYRLVTDGRTDRRMDRQTDEIAVASTAFAMRRTVKTVSGNVVVQSIAFRVVSIYWQYISL